MIDDRQPPLAPELVKEAQALIARFAMSRSQQEAVVAVHAGAVVQHAQSVGLLGPVRSARDALEHIADLHPALAGFAELQTLTAHEDAAVSEMWNRHQLMDLDGNAIWYSHPLGDLYQTLSEQARKGRALCQTPWWITKLLLRISYEHATRSWLTPTVIDPSCGTGHILVEALQRARGGHKIARHTYKNPTIGEAIDRINGVDVDPYAVLVARWRLLVMAWAQLRHRGTKRDLRDLPVHVAQADALLATNEPLLTPASYHVVLANPPYITPRDSATVQAIRQRYPQVCSGKFSLALPFHALMMQLLVPGGWCAQLTSNGFMKREFGKRYVEQWLPLFDLRWVIDTSGVYIPGHGTPTLILVHRNQPPSTPTVRTIGGKRGEPCRPEVPAQGKVWTAIREAVESVERTDELQRMFEEYLAEQGLAAGHHAGKSTSGATAEARQTAPPAGPGVQASLLELLDLSNETA